MLDINFPHCICNPMFWSSTLPHCICKVLNFLKTVPKPSRMVQFIFLNSRWSLCIRFKVFQMDAILGIGFRIMILRETHTLEKLKLRHTKIETHTLEKLKKQKSKLKAYT